MAKTRAQIKSSIDHNTGRADSKASLIEDLCNESLKVAIGKHPFRDAQSSPTILDIGEGTTSVNMSAITNLVHVVTARIIQDSGTQYLPLVLRDRAWWDRNVVNAADNTKGWPKYGLRWESTILLDRPAESDLQLQLIVSQDQTFANDTIECPVKILDTFVVQYVTAFVFLSIQNMQSYAYWKNIALGFKWDSGIVGGTLGHAIATDRYDISEEMRAEPPGAPGKLAGTSIRNLITGHDNYGDTITWY